MSVIVRFGTRKAILCGSRWQAADRELEDRLNAQTAEWLRETGGPPLNDRDPDLTTAMQVGFANGGKIHRHIPSDHASTLRPYIEARQMSLFALPSGR